MNYILDLIVIAIILIFVLITYKKGFVKTFLSLASLVLTILIISSFGEPLAELSYDSFIDKSVQKTVVKNIEASYTAAEEMTDSVWNSIPQFFRNNSEKVGVNKSNLDTLIVGNTESPQVIAQNISTNVVRPMAVSFLVIIIDVVLFVVLMFIFRFLSKLICTLFKAPVLKQANKFLGIILGAVKGIAVAILVCSIIAYIASVNGNGFLIFNQTAIDNSILFKTFCILF